MSDESRDMERVDNELRYFREAIDEVRQTLTRVVTLLEGTEKLREKVEAQAVEAAALKERLTQSEAKAKDLAAEWSAFKTKALWVVLGGGALAGGAGSGALSVIKAAVTP
jgi:predicted nuclease with TOPRIM domain